jgi:hypothetical protein
MLRPNIRFRDEPEITVAAAVSFAAALLVGYLPTRFFSAAALRVLTPFLLVVIGALLLRRVRSQESLAIMVLTAIISASMFALYAAFTAVTGWTFSKYNPHPLPRTVSLAYLLQAMIALCMATVSSIRYRARRKELERY